MNHGPTRAPRWTPTRAAPFWLCWAGVGLAALFLLRSTNWAREGFSSPTGEYLFILIRAAMLWILVTSITLVRAAHQGLLRKGARLLDVVRRRVDARYGVFNKRKGTS